MSYRPGNLIQNEETNEDIQIGARSHAEYTRLTRLIPSNINRVTQQVKEINQLISKLGTDSDTVEFRTILHDRQHKTNQVCHETAKHIKDVKNLPLPENASERRQRNVRIDRLKKDFEKALNLFQNAQNQSAAKEKREVARVRALGSSMQDVGFESPENMRENIQLQELTTVDMKELREREDGLRKLEDDIMTVNDIFKDLASMVEDQGEIIDSIEAHVVRTDDHVSKGKNELKEAVVHRKSARRKKLICAVVVVVVCVIIVIAIIIAASV